MVLVPGCSRCFFGSAQVRNSPRLVMEGPTWRTVALRWPKRWAWRTCGNVAHFGNGFFGLWLGWDSRFWFLGCVSIYKAPNLCCFPVFTACDLRCFVGTKILVCGFDRNKWKPDWFLSGDDFWCRNGQLKNNFLGVSLKGWQFLGKSIGGSSKKAAICQVPGPVESLKPSQSSGFTQRQKTIELSHWTNKNYSKKLPWKLKANWVYQLDAWNLLDVGNFFNRLRYHRWARGGSSSRLDGLVCTK